MPELILVSVRGLLDIDGHLFLTASTTWPEQRGGTNQGAHRSHARLGSTDRARSDGSSAAALTADALQWTVPTPPHARLAVEIVLAWAATEKQLPGRLRPCANDECQLFLLDRSSANRARWCSMAVCGNREKGRSRTSAT